jgi:hypothetical protein
LEIWPGKFITCLVESPPNGALKHGTPLWRLLLKACAVNLASEAASILQNDPLPEVLAEITGDLHIFRTLLTIYLQPCMY